jgi:predicted RNA-binding protein with PUA-like domain
MKYWLFKSEPDPRIVDGVDVSYGLDALIAEPDQTCDWDGVRNYQARNCMMQMKAGDRGFFYHSNCKQVGGTAKTRSGIGAHLLDLFAFAAWNRGRS